jgi:hypothetical protein
MHSALAVYIHASGDGETCEPCCKKTGSTIMGNLLKNKNKTVIGISNFTSKIDKEGVDQMCMVWMFQKKTETWKGEEESHMFTFELRENTQAVKGFYLYSSWANFFSLEWFLGLKENMRSEMSENLQKKAANEDSDAKQLRKKCGLKKFIEFTELGPCMDLFLKIFEQKTETGLTFRFNCTTLNEKFKNLKH